MNTQEDNCIFCKVGRGEIPHNRVHENESFVAFLDIKPVEKGHTLIIPKEHVVWMQEAQDKTVGDIFIFAKKLMLALKQGLNCDYVQVSVVGKDMPHFHVHLIPRFYHDELEHNLHVESKKYDEGEEKEIIEKIISAL